jgi:hypothetical protein
MSLKEKTEQAGSEVMLFTCIRMLSVRFSAATLVNLLKGILVFLVPPGKCLDILSIIPQLISSKSSVNLPSDYKQSRY